MSNAVVPFIIYTDVDDPYALEPGEKIRVSRSTRDDPLGDMYERKMVTEFQFHAGRAFQDDFETIQSRPQAIDLSQPFVDRSFKARGISEAYSKAFDRLNAAHAALGQIGSALAQDVLIDSKTRKQVAAARGLEGKRWEEYFGMRFRECLDCLALVYGFSMESGR